MTPFETWMLLLNTAFIVSLVVIPLVMLFAPQVRTIWLNCLRIPFAIALCWIAYNLQVTLQWEIRMAELAANPSPTKAEIMYATADGANRVFALIAGWIPATLYVLLWWIALRIFKRIPRNAPAMSSN